MAEPQATTPFAIKVNNHLFLDSENRFHSSPPAGAKVYEIGGGMLSLSNEVRGGLLSGALAVLPLKNEASWMGKLRKLGIDEDVLQFFGAAAEIATSIVSVIGWAQAAMKILEMLGLFNKKPSLEEMVRQALQKLDIIIGMTAAAQKTPIELAIDTSRGFIEANRDHCEEQGRTLNTAETRVLYTLAERKQMRKEMVEKVEAADGHLRTLLSSSRWELLCINREYKGSWGFHTDTEEHEIKNPDWWGKPRDIPRQQLSDDSLTWVNAVYPAGYQTRFDHRAALPHAIYGLMSLIAMLQITEPEFRTTGFMREPLKKIAEQVEELMRRMRASFLRTKHNAEQFRFVDQNNVMLVPQLGKPVTSPDQPPLGIPILMPVLKQPLFYWQVGAIDLCAHTDSYFNNLGTRPPTSPDRPYKLGTLDFDWIPSSYQLRWVEPPFHEWPWAGHWEIANAEECAAEADRQSEADYVLLLQQSGYFQLAQLHATLKHLATDPEQSETVSGYVRSVRREASSRREEVKGYDGLFCDQITATATVKEFSCKSTVTLTTQEPDRVHKVPTKFFLVALSAPAGSGMETLLSQVELLLPSDDDNDPEITLPLVQTFDFFVEKTLGGEQLWSPTTKQLKQLGTRSLTLPGRVPTGVPNPPATPPTDGTPLGDIRRVARLTVDYYTLANELPSGDIRNKKVEPYRFGYRFSLIETDTQRGAWVEITSRPGQRNANHIYVATEERLSSGQPLRTYFAVEMYTQLKYVSPFFFQQERECLEKTEKIVDEIDRRFAESAPALPPHVPVTVDALRNRAARARRNAPDLVKKLLRDKR
ncbi:MAG: hypothetical protein ICV60_13195 [Pyrinomonadaceae bacterium]|nr:hypothetical protein [Pyrinomonadaceae bacterium]